MSTTCQLEMKPTASDILTLQPVHTAELLLLWCIFFPSSIPSTNHRTQSFVCHIYYLLCYLIPSLHLLHLIIISSLLLTHRANPCSVGPDTCSTITLLCHHSSEIADGLLFLTPLLTEFTAIPLLSPACPPLSCSLSVSLPSSLIPFRGKSILLGSGSKNRSIKPLVHLSWLVREGQKVVIKSRASCTTQCTRYRLLQGLLYATL